MGQIVVGMAPHYCYTGAWQLGTSNMVLHSLMRVYSAYQSLFENDWPLCRALHLDVRSWAVG